MLQWCTVAILAVVAYAQQDNIFDNDLAKVCRPLDRSIDVMFILDGSGSNAGEIFETQMRMVNQVVDMVEIGENKTRVAVLQYSGWSKMEFDFADYHDKVSMRKAINGITHVSGSTRTGRALDRALEAFGEKSGGRMGRPDVAQVAVVVSDGRSIDDPGTSADALRKHGVIVMSMGIGHRVFMKELERIAGGNELAFKNETMKDFIDTFRKIAIGEQCDYAKGPNGVEILCKENMIEVNVLTRLPFVGHLYVPNYYENPKCKTQAQGTEWEPSRTLSLTIPLESCGVQKQFLFKPRGLMFETAVTLKYHPKYNSPKDQTFNIRCFYPDMHFSNGEPTTLTSEEVEQAESHLGPSFSAPEMVMPCAYKVVHSERGCLMENSMVGKRITHTWECDRKILGTAYGMLVRSCFMVNDRGTEHKIIDENGCVIDSNVIDQPVYNNLKVSAEGTVVKFADSNDIKFRCSIQFCNQAKGECDEMLPPRCSSNSSQLIRNKRQVIRTQLADAMTHPDMINRLFGARNFLVQRNGGFKIQAMSSAEKGNTIKLLKPQTTNPVPSTTTTQSTTTTTERTPQHQPFAHAEPRPAPSPAPRVSLPSGGLSVSVNTFNQLQNQPQPPSSLIAVPARTPTFDSPPAPPSADNGFVDITREQRQQWRESASRNRASFELVDESLEENLSLQTLQPTPEPYTIRPILPFLNERANQENLSFGEEAEVPTPWSRSVGLEFLEVPVDVQPVIENVFEQVTQRNDDQVLEFVASAEKTSTPASYESELDTTTVEAITKSEDSTTSTTTTTTRLPTTTTEEHIDMNLQGLAEDILKKLNFMQVDIESQTMQINAESEKEQRSSHLHSPVNWCPRDL